MLMKVDLSANYIEVVPPQFCRLTNLRILYLHFNLLRTVEFVDKVWLIISCSFQKVSAMLQSLTILFLPKTD